MSSYVTLEMSTNTFNEIIWYIELAIKHENNINQLIEMVHTIDFLEEEESRSRATQNKIDHRWMEQQELFNGSKVEKDVRTLQLFNTISSVFDGYYKDEMIEFDKIDPETEFHLIYDIIDKVKEVMVWDKDSY